MNAVSEESVQTSSGPARVQWHEAARPRGLLVLGPGASGAITAADLAVARDAALDVGLHVGLVEPPYRVAGRKVPPRGPGVDEAWLTVVAHLTARAPGMPLVVGGRSFGSRVACRTASEAGAVGVLCLAYPLHPPGRPEVSRAAELDAAGDLPVLVVQGERDPFGRPEPGPHREIVLLPGDHGLKKDLPGVRAAVSTWLERLLG